MSIPAGSFIVLEGLDGSGTTTQTARLVTALRGFGLAAMETREPTDGPVGRLIRESLSGADTTSGEGEKARFSEEALSLLFAADRAVHSVWIEAHRNDNHIVSDRFVHSSIAYQSLDPSITAQRVIELNRYCAVPTVTLFLDVPVDECVRRLGARSDAPTVYEKKALLERIDKNYRKTRGEYEVHFGKIISIDGRPPVDEVHQSVLSIARELIGF